MTITYFKGGEDLDSDALPSWDAVLESNGVTPDLSTGWTIRCLQTPPSGDPVLKTAGFTPGPDGAVLVQWDPGELDDLPYGTTRLALIATRDSDSKSFTVRERLFIRPR